MVVEFVLVRGRVNPMPGRAAINQDQALGLLTDLPIVKIRKLLLSNFDFLIIFDYFEF
jgi:hypothetical protein